MICVILADAKKKYYLHIFSMVPVLVSVFISSFFFSLLQFSTLTFYLLSPYDQETNKR